MPREFRDLRVWQEGISFCKDIYSVVNSFPKFEETNIISQLRRASTSISTNIAEGCGKWGIKEEIAFHRIAQGSTKECMSLLILSKELKYLNEFDFQRLFDQAEKISKMLTLFIQSKRKMYFELKRKGFAYDGTKTNQFTEDRSNERNN